MSAKWWEELSDIGQAMEYAVSMDTEPSEAVLREWAARVLAVAATTAEKRG